MQIKKWKLKIATFISLILILLSVVGPSAAAFTVAETNSTDDNVSVDIKQIKELSGDQLSSSTATPSQSLAQTIATLVSHDPAGPDGSFTVVDTAQDVLKYLYPNYTAAQLQGTTITPEQAVSWLHSVGYTATITNRALTTSEIKDNLDKSEPIVAILSNQNSKD